MAQNDVKSSTEAGMAAGRLKSIAAVAVVAAGLAFSGGTAPWSNAATAQEIEPDAIPENKPLESKVPDTEAGLQVARKLCVSCHLIGEAPDGSMQGGVPLDVPSFTAIANRPNQSLEALKTWLMAPHQPMPDPHLSRIEIRDLAGYILTLRKPPPQ